MNWKTINSEASLEEVKAASHKQRILIFKHSTRCSISAMALNRMERAWNESEMQGLTPYFLDLIAYRPISNKVAADFGVQHESPQVLVIENGECIYNTSHMGINYQELKQFASISTN
ncbi:MAG: bacillithiol system redox-active protein YtxJ [Flammeovirgaceae bacterium]